MAAILVFAHGPKSIASIFSVVCYYISKLKSIGEMVLKISRSQVGWKDGRTEGRTTGISMSYPNFVCGGQLLEQTDEELNPFGDTEEDPYAFEDL